MNDSIGVRRPEQYSPKSSPRGSRSPLVHRHDTTTGTLRTTISLGKTPAIVHSGPFYLMKEAPGESQLTGAKNLMSFYNLEHAYSKFSGRKMKDQLSAFLPNLPGNIDIPGHQDNSSLRSLIDKPPIGGKELQILNGAQLAGFRLHPGPIPEQFRLMSHQPQKNKKHKHKKHKHKSGEALSNEQPQEAGGSNEGGSTGAHEKKDRKRKRHDDEKERKKKKKEKRKKKQKHTPESGSATPNPSTSTDVRKI